MRLVRRTMWICSSSSTVPSHCLIWSPYSNTWRKFWASLESIADGAGEAWPMRNWWRASGTHRAAFSLTHREKWGITLAMDTPTSTPSHIGTRERWVTTALLGLGLITFAIDASNTQLILPQIMTSMRVDLHEIHWILTAPGIARTVIIASTGWLTGLWGPRTLYLICIGSMAIGSLGTMLAWDWTSLILFRVLAGVGGGMIPQLAQAIFYQIFSPGKRGMALGFSLMGWSIGPAFGPLMGGNLLEMGSWRVVYAMTLPLSGVGFILAWWWLPHLGRPQRRRLDYYGALTMVVAVSTLLLALSQGNREGWDSQYIITLLAIAGVAAAAFVVVGLRHPEPLVELRLLSSVPFVM